MQSKPVEITFPFLVLTLALTAAAAWLRLAGTGWDEFASLHPDERHLLFVISEMISKYSSHAWEYGRILDLWFATGRSPLDPHSAQGGLVYGEFPILMVVLLAINLDINEWVELLKLGRSMTAVLDSLTVLCTIILCFEVTGKKYISLLAGFLYASAPTSQQLANFYTVDVWLTSAFAWTAFLLVLLVKSQTFTGAIRFAAWAGLFVGIAVASKITGLFAGLAVLLAIVFRYLRFGVSEAACVAVVLGLSSLIAYRFVNPFAFAGPGLFDLSISTDFLDEFFQAYQISGSPDFPPNWQWMNGYDQLDFLRDFLLFGCGPVIGVFLLFGINYKPAARFVWILLLLIIPIIAYTVLNQSQPLRYAAPAIPILATLAAVGIANTRFPLMFGLIAAILGAWWGSGVYFLHTSPHPRLEASRWLWSLPKGTVLANESDWDDGLPVPVMLPGETHQRWPGHDDHFELHNLQLTTPDSREKVERLVGVLSKSDYLIISSGRQKLVLPKFPERFPMTKRYYEMLDNGDMCFKIAWQDTRGYRLPLLSFPDTWVQEPWRVYDHPIVEIYKKQSCFDQTGIRNVLDEVLEGL